MATRHRLPSETPRSTPWGAPQSTKQIAPGIVSFTTAGHGGIWLSKARMESMPEWARGFVTTPGGHDTSNNWFEEDAEWCIPCLAFAAEWKAWYEREGRAEQFQGTLESAERTLLNWNPDTWEKFRKETVRPGASYARDREIFGRRHAQDWVMVSCIAPPWSGAPNLPEDCVLVWATRGGDRASRLARHTFLVKKAHFHAEAHPDADLQPGAQSYVVKPSRDRECDETGKELTRP